MTLTWERWGSLNEWTIFTSLPFAEAKRCLLCLCSETFLSHGERKEERAMGTLPLPLSQYEPHKKRRHRSATWSTNAFWSFQENMGMVIMDERERDRERERGGDEPTDYLSGSLGGESAPARTHAVPRPIRQHAHTRPVWKTCEKGASFDGRTGIRTIFLSFFSSSMMMKMTPRKFFFFLLEREIWNGEWMGASFNVVRFATEKEKKETKLRAREKCLFRPTLPNGQKKRSSSVCGPKIYSCIPLFQFAKGLPVWSRKRNGPCEQTSIRISGGKKERDDLFSLTPRTKNENEGRPK